MGDEAEPSVAIGAQMTGLAFCGITVMRAGPRYDYRGKVIGQKLWADSLQLVAVSHVDPNSSFYNRAPAVTKDQGGYFLLGRVELGTEWTYHGPSPIGLDDVTLRRNIGYYLATTDQLIRAARQATRFQGGKANQGFVMVARCPTADNLRAPAVAQTAGTIDFNRPIPVTMYGPLASITVEPLIPVSSPPGSLTSTLSRQVPTATAGTTCL